MFNILIFHSFSKFFFVYCTKRVRGTTRRIENSFEKQKNVTFQALFLFPNLLPQPRIHSSLGIIQFAATLKAALVELVVSFILFITHFSRLC